MTDFSLEGKQVAEFCAAMSIANAIVSDGKVTTLARVHITNTYSFVDATNTAVWGSIPFGATVGKVGTFEISPSTIVKLVKGAASVRVMDEGKSILVLTNRGKYNIAKTGIETMRMPIVDDSICKFSIPAETLSAVLSEISYANETSNQEPMEYLTGLHISVANDGILLAIANRERAALYLSDEDFVGEPIGVSLNSSVIGLLKSVLPAMGEGYVHVSILEGGKVSFKIEDLVVGGTVYTDTMSSQLRMIYENAAKESLPVTVDAKDLAREVNRIKVLAPDNMRYRVDIEVAADLENEQSLFMRLSTGSDMGTGTATVPVETGALFNFSASSTYLSQALRSANSESGSVLLGYGSNMVIIKSDNVLHVMAGMK